MRRLRPLAIALLILIAIDVVLRSPLFPLFPYDFRFPRVTVMGYEQFLEYGAKQDSVRVAVVGDSVAQGIAVERDGTLPAQWDVIYQEQGRAVDVYNYGISAAHAEDMYPVVASLTNRDAADVVVWYFNYTFYGETSTEYGGRYPELWREAGSFEPHEDHPLITADKGDEPTPTVEGTIDETVSRVWKLYGDRDYLNAVLFDGTPAMWLEHHTNWQYGGYHFLPVWRKLTVDQFSRESLEDAWSTTRFDDQNVQLEYLRLALEKAQHEGTEMVVMWGPINHEVVEYYGLVDPDDYAYNRVYVREMTESYGGTFVDVDEGFPVEYIADSVHPFAEGYAVMAERMAEELDPLIETLEAEKAGEQ